MAYKFTGAPKGPMNAPKPSSDAPLSKGELKRLKREESKRCKNKEPIAPTPQYEAKVRREREEEKKKQELLKQQQDVEVTEVSEVTTEAITSEI